MGGIDWQALPIVAEIIGSDDVEALVIALLQIKEYQDAKNG